MMAYRAVAQQPINFFLEHKNVFCAKQDPQFGVDEIEDLNENIDESSRKENINKLSANDDIKNETEKEVKKNSSEDKEDPEVTIYRSLTNLVTHQGRRVEVDVATKAVFAHFLCSCLKKSGYFELLEDSEELENAENVVREILLRFLQVILI